MRFKRTKLLPTALFLALVPTALASTTWYVNGVHGSDGNNCKSPSTACKTIGHAISLAASGDSIMVAAATYRENPITIVISLNVLGAGASTTIIDGGGVHGVVVISPTGTATIVLSGLTIRNGSAADGGGIYNSGGTLTINNSIVSGNQAIAYCYRPFGCYGAAGGGIYNSGGTLTINNSTVSGNQATGRCIFVFYPSCSRAAGAGIYNSGGTTTINNGTVSGNHAKSSCYFHYCVYSTGGGMYNNGSLTVSNSTMSGNTGSGTGGDIFAFGGTVRIQNSIISGGGNCAGKITSDGYNLSSDNTCNFNGPGDLNSTDPMLGPLQNNGGPTQTMALLPGSPAIDAGNPSGCKDAQGKLLKTDQRGMPRPDKEDTGRCDMGAYERQSD